MLYNRYNLFTTEVKTKKHVKHHFTGISSAEFKPPPTNWYQVVWNQIKWTIAEWISVNLPEKNCLWLSHHKFQAQVEVQISPEPEEVKSTSAGADPGGLVCWLFCWCCDFCCILSLYIICTGDICWCFFMCGCSWCWWSCLRSTLISELRSCFPHGFWTYTTSLSLPSSRLIRSTSWMPFPFWCGFSYYRFYHIFHQPILLQLHTSSLRNNARHAWICSTPHPVTSSIWA